MDCKGLVLTISRVFLLGEYRTKMQKGPTMGAFSQTSRFERNLSFRSRGTIPSLPHPALQE